MRQGVRKSGKKAGTSGVSLLSLPNMGKVTAAKLAKIGIETQEEFLKRDPYEVFEELRTKVDPTLCRCALAGIVGAKKGVPWHKITKASAKEYEKRHPLHKWGPC
jgi:TfoX C-terminal domain